MAMVNLLRQTAGMPSLVCAMSALTLGAVGVTDIDVSFSGIAEGDLMVIVVRITGGYASTPSGWTLHRQENDGSQSGQVFTKVADSGDVGAPTATAVMPDNYFSAAAAFAYRGASGIADSEWAHDLSGFQTTLPLVAPDLTAPQQGVYVAVWANDNASASLITPPGGMTAQTSQTHTFQNITMADEQILTAGATGDRTATDGSNMTGEATYSLFIIG